MRDTVLGGFRLSPATDRETRLLRGRDAALAAAATALGLAPPDILRSASSERMDALWLGPDEWLLIGSDPDATLIDALASFPHSLVDVSDRLLGFEATGTALISVLNAGCPLDLSEARFPVGMCTRTVLAKAEIILWRRADNLFHIGVARSFAPYLVAYLDEVSRGVDRGIAA